jgi:hypothetical protein
VKQENKSEAREKSQQIEEVLFVDESLHSVIGELPPELQAATQLAREYLGSLFRIQLVRVCLFACKL